MSNFIVIDEVPATCCSVDANEYPYLADMPLVKSDQIVDILVGQDYAEALLPLEVRRGDKRDDPFAVKTFARLVTYSQFQSSITHYQCKCIIKKGQCSLEY